MEAYFILIHNTGNFCCLANQVQKQQKFGTVATEAHRLIMEEDEVIYTYVAATADVNAVIVISQGLEYRDCVEEKQLTKLCTAKMALYTKYSQ